MFALVHASAIWLQSASGTLFRNPRTSRKISGSSVLEIYAGDPMAQVYPFRALRYNPDKVSFDRVLTQPYDKISQAAQERYYNSDPHNLIAIEKGRTFPTDNSDNNVYIRARAALQKWIDQVVVQQDHAASFYAYSQEYAV